MHIVRSISAKLFISLSFFLGTSAVHALDAGSVAPEFDLPGRTEAIKLASQRGKTVYVDFWASWCAPCKQSFPWMNEMQEKYRSKGLQIIGINVDAKESDAKKFLETTPANFIVAFDHAGATPKQYGIRGMPTSFLVGPDGKIIFEHSGFNAGTKAALEEKIKQALKEK